MNYWRAEGSRKDKKPGDYRSASLLSIVDGRKIGQVKDLIINPEEGKVDYIMVSNGSWYVGAQVLSSVSNEVVNMR